MIRLGGEGVMNDNLTSEVHSAIKWTPLKITSIYMFIGVLWLLFSEQLLVVFVENPATQIYLRTIKGWFYVIAMSSMLYVLVRRGFLVLNHSREMLRISEKRFRDLVENSLTGISIVQNDRIVYQNKEQERLLGPLPRSSKLVDFKNIHPDDTEKIQNFNKVIFSDKVHTIDVSFRFLVPDKNNNKFDMKWAYCRATTTEYEGKKTILTNIMDITRTKEMEHLLKIQDKMTSLGRVAAGIAHEIRNPLSGINIYLNTLEKIYDRPENLDKVKGIIGQIQSASRKIESVIKRVMDFSKPSTPNFVLTNINQPVEDAIQLSSATLRKSGVKIERALSENLPQCRIDPFLIEQVVLNLITNAAEAMKNMDGTKTIEVTSSVENDRVLVKVSDSGPGVPIDQKDKVFDPFYTTKNESTGIGLSLSHRNITDHNGSLTLGTSKWGGAEFIIEMPLA